MASVDTSLRPFEPGSTGWSASDLDDPEIERLWSDGRYEIIDGVLADLGPAYFTSGVAVAELLFACHRHIKSQRGISSFAPAVDIIIDQWRVVRADAVMMMPSDLQRHNRAVRNSGRDPKRTRILVPPTLVIESVCPGHELHDTRTKLRWYAKFGVPNYWILDAFEETLVCWMMRDGAYHRDVDGAGANIIRPKLFPGLDLSLSEFWYE